METVVIVIHLMVVIALVAVILLQKSEGGALGIGGGGGGFMTGRGTANVLTRTTTILAIAFFATSITLTLLARQSGPTPSIFDNAPASSGAPAQTQTTPSQPAGGTILDQIRDLERQQQPSGPQVPQSE
jgi:preprotein translocase subunit SecG